MFPPGQKLKGFLMKDVLEQAEVHSYSVSAKHSSVWETLFFFKKQSVFVSNNTVAENSPFPSGFLRMVET